MKIMKNKITLKYSQEQMDKLLPRQKKIKNHRIPGHVETAKLFFVNIYRQ